MTAATTLRHFVYTVWPERSYSRSVVTHAPFLNLPKDSAALGISSVQSGSRHYRYTSWLLSGFLSQSHPTLHFFLGTGKAECQGPKRAADCDPENITTSPQRRLQEPGQVLTCTRGEGCVWKESKTEEE